MKTETRLDGDRFWRKQIFSQNIARGDNATTIFVGPISWLTPYLLKTSYHATGPYKKRRTPKRTTLSAGEYLLTTNWRVS